MWNFYKFHSCTCSSFIHAFICPFYYHSSLLLPFTYSPFHSPNPSGHSFTHSPTNPPTHTSNSPTHKTYSLTHPLNHQSVDVNTLVLRVRMYGGENRSLLLGWKLINFTRVLRTKSTQFWICLETEKGGEEKMKVVCHP